MTQNFAGMRPDSDYESNLNGVRERGASKDQFDTDP